MDKSTLKEKIKHIENQIEAMKKDLDIVSKYSKFPLERSIKSLEDELQEIKELELMMSENEEKGIAELSRGFQSYVLRNINKVKRFFENYRTIMPLILEKDRTISQFKYVTSKNKFAMNCRQYWEKPVKILSN